MRNPIFDIMKFIAIIAMIIGHCVHDWRLQLIYPWHMPLFFIVSGYFFKPQTILKTIKHSTRQLLIPYLITAIAIITLALIYNFFDANHDILNYTKVVLMGGTNPNTWGIGFASWFLISLFVCTVTYSVLNHFIKSNRLITTIVIIIAFSTYYIKNYFSIFIPFTLLQSGMGLLFFHIGHIFHQRNTITFKHYPIYLWACAIFFCIASFHFGALDMFFVYYSNIIINILGAIGAYFIIFQFSSFFCSHFPKFALKIAQLGSITILFLMVHTIDTTFNIAPQITQKVLFFIENITPNIAERILFTLIVSLLLYQIPIVRKVLRLSKHQYLDIKALKS
ncbi:MAG: acyltransferase family protein [Muribaculaceae bacterium]|nr:acyltransferase family protein [Muribaculaceae bacterium]